MSLDVTQAILVEGSKRDFSQAQTRLALFDEDGKPLTFGGGIASYDELILEEPSLVGYWPLDDAPGSTTAKDKKGSNNGSVAGTAPVFGSDAPLSDGKTSMWTDGVDDRIEIPDVAELRTPEIASHSVEFWGRVEATGNGPGFSYDNAGGVIYISNGGVRVRLGGVSLGNIDLAYWNAVSIGIFPGAEFEHWVATWNDTTKEFVFYRNGAGRYREVLTGSLTLSGANWGIGGLTGLGFTKGNWAKCALYNAALTKQQIRKHYLTGIGAAA